jgi:hypothetical protein
MAQQTAVDNGYKLPINNSQKDWFKVENNRLKHCFELHTKGGFLWRLWFLISAPIIWLIKGEVKIK